MRRYILVAIGDDGRDVLVSTIIKNEDQLQEVQVLMAEQLAEDFIYSQEKEYAG